MSDFQVGRRYRIKKRGGLRHNWITIEVTDIDRLPSGLVLLWAWRVAPSGALWGRKIPYVASHYWSGPA